MAPRRDTADDGSVTGGLISGGPPPVTGTTTDNRAPSPTKKPIAIPQPIGGVGADSVQQGTPGLRTGDMVGDLEAGVLGVAPGYFDGDEWMFVDKSPEDIANIQVLLVQAGLLSDDIPIGAWDARSATAFRKILEVANRTGTDWSTALLGYADKPTLGDLLGKGSTRAPFVARLSNPDDLKEVFKQAAYNRLGGKGFVDDEQLQRFVDTYQEQEMRAQRAAYNAAPSGGTVTEAPAADVEAEAALKEADPAGFKAAGFARYASVLESLIGGTGG
jgi:hypothetical protein